MLVTFVLAYYTRLGLVKTSLNSKLYTPKVKTHLQKLQQFTVGAVRPQTHPNPFISWCFRLISFSNSLKYHVKSVGMIQSSWKSTYQVFEKSQFAWFQIFPKIQGILLNFVIWIKGWNLFHLVVYQLYFKVLLFPDFLEFCVGPTISPKSLAGLSLALCSCTAEPPLHTTTLMVVFWPPQWSHNHQLRFFPPPPTRFEVLTSCLT